MDLTEKISKFLEETKAKGKKPLIVILGPTAAGKTALSITLAKKFDGEIISADSRQIYKNMDIGTDAISKEEQGGIPHHMIRVKDPDQEFTLSDYKLQARRIIDEILRKRKVPFLVGGTGLYISALTENYQIPRVAPNFSLRHELQREYEEKGEEALHKKLAELDPEAARNIHPNNVRYVIRAIEINLETEQTKPDQKSEPIYEVFYIGIEWPREILYERINRRVDEQVKRGLFHEVKGLLDRGYRPELPSMSSLGCKEIVEYLQGNISREEAIELVKKNTRNYAKRQMTWFRRYKEVHWLQGSELEKQL